MSDPKRGELNTAETNDETRNLNGQDVADFNRAFRIPSTPVTSEKVVRQINER